MLVRGLMRHMLFIQLKKELVAEHALNMESGIGRQRTYGPLTDGMGMIIVCFDAGESFLSWTTKNLKDLRGTFTSSRCACVCVVHT